MAVHVTTRAMIARGTLLLLLMIFVKIMSRKFVSKQPDNNESEEYFPGKIKNNFLTPERCPNFLGEEVKWKHLITKIVEYSYINLFPYSRNGTWIWESGKKIDISGAFCFYTELQDRVVVCQVRINDVTIKQTA